MKFIHSSKFLTLVQSESQNQKEGDFYLGLVSRKKNRKEWASNTKIIIKLPCFTEAGNVAITFHIHLKCSWILDGEFSLSQLANHST